MPKGTLENTVLVLQGGGALGAYQAGAYAALAEAGYMPQWLAGISIGSLNTAIIAGNPPEQRVAQLRAFWEGVSARLVGSPPVPGWRSRSLFNDASSALAAISGIPGFFAPRFPPAIFMPAGSPQAISYYDTAPLRETLGGLIDFDLLNAGDLRLSIGAVNIASGNFVYFDSHDVRITVEHVMASCALPPGFPPAEIDGQLYWDGGLVSNTPLQYVLDGARSREDMCIFQVDLFSASGPLPATMADVERREKEIRFSSRTRMNTTVGAELQRIRRAARRLHDKLPPELKHDPDARFLVERGHASAITICHLIYRQASYETQSGDLDFSRLSVEDHWKAGGDDVHRTLHHPAWQRRERPVDGIAELDLTRDGRL